MKQFECFVYLGHDDGYTIAIHQMVGTFNELFNEIKPTSYLPYWRKGWHARISCPSVKDCMMRLLNLIPELQE